MADNKHVVKKTGGYGKAEDGSYVAFDSRYPGGFVPKQDQGNSVGASKAAAVMNRMNAGNTIMTNDMGVWRGVDPGYASNTYGQQAIQGLLDLKGMTDGSDLVVYDTEILGTTPFNRKSAAHADFYAPTEIGFQHVKMVNGQLVKQDYAGSSMSMLLKPNEEVYQRLDAAINDLASKKWSGLTDDMRRTLSDLTLYAGDTSKMFKVNYKDGRRIVSVMEQSRNLRPNNNMDLSSSETIANMKQGLKNLLEWGTKPEDAIVEMNNFMKGFQNTRFAGYNVYSFDQPMMLDYLNTQVGKHNPNSPVGKALDRLKSQLAINQIDGLHAVRTLYKDLYDRYGDRTTLERMKATMLERNPDKYGFLNDGQAHHALSDVNTTIAQLNELITDPHVSAILKTGGVLGSDFGGFNSQTLKVGDRLFGYAGMNSRDAGAYDGIYRMKGNKLLSAYDMNPNPIYRNTSYTIKNFFDGINIDGKTMYGIHLYNEDDDLHHTIFRESEGALQSAIHQHLEYVDGKTQAHGGLHGNQNADRAMRRWNKMFSTEAGGGIRLATRLYDALDTYNDVGAQYKEITTEKYWRDRGLSKAEAKKQAAKGKRVMGKMQKRAVLRQSEYNTNEFYRDFLKMKGRLEGEGQWHREFIKRIQQAHPVSGPDDFAGYRAQSIAFAEYGKNLDKEFGINTSDRSLHGGRALNITIDGNTRLLNLTSGDNVRRSLYSHLYQGHYDRPNIEILKGRYRQLLLQLKSYNALDAKKFEKMWDALEGQRGDVSLDNMLNDLSNAVMRAKETSTLHGALDTITVENPTKLSDKRAANMGAADFKPTFNRIFNQTFTDVQPHLSKWKDGQIHLFGNDAMELVTKHDNAIQMLMERNGLIDRTGKPLVQGMNLGNLKSSRSALAELAQAFYTEGMHVQFRYDGKRRGLQMVLADKNVAQSLLDGSIEDIMKSNSAAVIDLPRLMKDGSLTLGSQNRTSRFKAKRLGTGGYELVTGFHEILDTLKYNAGTVRNMLDDAKLASMKDGKDDGMIQVHKYLNQKARKAMQNLSMNNRFAAMNNLDNPFETKSMGANWIRSGLFDISSIAEDWYTDFYNTMKATQPNRVELWRLKTPDEVSKLAAKNGELFVDSMGMNARRVFQREADTFWKDQTGMNLGMHSAKDVHISNYLRSNLDARELLAFGFYNPMGRENIMKTVNYQGLDKRTVRRMLKNQRYSDAEIDRIMSRGVVSEGALDVMEEYKTGEEGGKISYLNMRTAYMNDQQIFDRLTKGGVAEKWANIYEQRAKNTKSEKQKAKWQAHADRLRQLQSVSTYDGMFLMSEEAGQAFNTYREKRFTLKEGEELSDEIKKLIYAHHVDGENLDWSKDITIDKWKTHEGGMIRNPKLLTNYGSEVDTYHDYFNGGKKLTISNIVRHDVLEHDEHGNVIYDGHTPRTKTQVVGTGQVYDKWYANKTEIKGWDAETRTLVLSETVNAMNSFKAITEGGHRATATFLRQEVISDLVGDKSVRAIMPQFEVSKGMFGTELSRMVGMAVDEAKRQIDNGGIVTVGKIAKEEALQTINKIMQDSFGIGSSLSYIKDGQIIVNRHLGSASASMGYTAENMNKFASAMNAYLGTDKFGGKTLDHTTGVVHFGNLGIGKQDVFDWENGVGMVGDHSEGLVRWGRKEVDMITHRVESVLGKGSAVTGWLQEHLATASAAQSRDIHRIARGLVKTAVYHNEVTPDKGDVVIRTTSSGSFHPDDPDGIVTGRTTEHGVHEISMYALNDIPKVTAKNMVTTAQMYAGTIVDFGRAKGKFADGTSFEDMFKKNGGTALLELPDSDAITRRYLRLVDFGDVTRGDTAHTPVLRELQTIQQQLWRNINEYNQMNRNGKLSGVEADDKRQRIEDRINELADSYENKAARMVSNSRDGGLSKTFGAAKMDNAGRFRIQGVNPFATYQALDKETGEQLSSEQLAAMDEKTRKETVDYKWRRGEGKSPYRENTVYLSRNRLAEMIGDERGYANKVTMNVASALGLDEKIEKLGYNLKDHGDKIMDLVLDNVNRKGLYGFVNRYPTIRQSTVQAMRFAIDDSIDPSDRTARLTVGTAHRLKADFDGDFLSTVLAHFSAEKDRALAVNGELRSIARVEAKAARVKGADVVSDLQNGFFDTAKSMNITVGDLATRISELEGRQQQMHAGVKGLKDFTEEEKSLLMDFGNGGVKSKYLNPEDILETREARLGKEFVGLIDNARDRISNLTSATFDTLEAHGKITPELASKYRLANGEFKSGINEFVNEFKANIQDFTADFSQDSISAKKFSVKAEIQRQFDLDPDNLSFANQEHHAIARERALKVVDERYNKLQDMIEALVNPTDANKDLFLKHNEEIQVFKNSEKASNVFDMIQKVAVWNNRSGSFGNSSLKIWQSEGQEQQRLSSIMLGMENHVVPTTANKHLLGIAKEEGENSETYLSMKSSMERYQRSLLQTFDRVEYGGNDALLKSMGSGFNPDEFQLSGATTAEQSNAKLTTMIGKFAPDFLHGGGAGGFGKGALAFGAMWAASAVVRRGVTPEGLQEQTQDPVPSGPVMSSNPTARITQNNGEYVNIRVNAKNAKNMSEQQVAALVHQELGAMTNTKLDTNINVNDNTQNIDPNWLQGVVAKAINGGYAF